MDRLLLLTYQTFSSKQLIENALEVFVNNVRQEPGTGKAFTLGLDGSNELKRITFTAAPANGASIYVINDKTSSVSIITPTRLKWCRIYIRRWRWHIFNSRYGRQNRF